MSIAGHTKRLLSAFNELADSYNLKQGHERADALRWFMLGAQLPTPVEGNGEREGRASPETTREYRKRPVVIEAWQWNGTTDWTTAPEWLQTVIGHWSPKSLLIPTLEGIMTALPGDWIIRGVMGEVYPCKPGIFEASYELMTETAS